MKRPLAMKRALVVLLLAAGAGGRARAQVLSAPDSTGRLVPVDSLTSAYDVGGVRVIQRESHESDVVAVDLVLLGGTQLLTPANAGIERLAVECGSFGSRRYPQGASHLALRRTGSQLYIVSDVDWTTVGFRGLADQFDSTFAVIADRIVAPTLDSDAVAVSRARLRIAARRALDEPDSWIARVADSVAFAGHPYALDPGGTPESLDAITVADVRRFAAEQFVTSRMMLVVVGPVSRARIERAVLATLATLPKGSYVWAPPPPMPAHKKASLTIIPHQASTNYILGLYGGPPVSSGDYPAFRIANEFIGGTLSREVRDRRSLSYSAGSPYLPRAVAVGGLYASTMWPDRVIPVMRDVVKDLSQSEIPNWIVGDFTDEFITGYYYANETSGHQADGLARAAVLNGDYRQAGRDFDRLRKISTGDVQRALHRYMHDIQLVYLGDPARLGKVDLGGL